MNDVKESLDEKLEKLELIEFKDKFSKEQIDICYNIYITKEIKKSNVDIIINIINKDILDVLEKENIENLSEFQVLRSDLLKIDGEKIVNDNWNKLKEIGMQKTRDLHFSKSSQIKSYILTMLKQLLKYVNYELRSYQTTNKYKPMYYYKVYEN